MHTEAHTAVNKMAEGFSKQEGSGVQRGRQAEERLFFLKGCQLVTVAGTLALENHGLKRPVKSKVEVTVNGVMALCEKGGKGGAQVALLPVGSCVQSQPTTVGSVPQKFTLGLNMHNPYLSCHRSLNKCSIVTTYIVFASC